MKFLSIDRTFYFTPPLVSIGWHGQWLTFIHRSEGEKYRIITSKLANQGGRKALLTGLVNTYT